MRGEICLVVPKRVSEKKAWEFAHQNREWVESRLAKLKKPTPLAHGETVPIFGIPRRIIITRTGGRVTACKLTETTLEVHTPREDPSANIRSFLQEQLESTARPCADTKARSIGKRINKLTLRDTRTRWGSCGPDGHMMLCWRLVFAPIDVIDYVVAHEVSHLRHMDHSPRFWALCDELSNDMDFAREWLNINGDTILRYGVRP